MTRSLPRPTMMHVAAFVDLAEVAGDEEAVRAEFGRGLLRHPPIALEDVGPLHLDHADLAARQLGSGLGIGDAHAIRPAAGSPRCRHAIAVVGVRRVHVRLGHAVALEDRVAGARGPFAMRLGQQRRRTRNEQAHVLRRFLRQARMLPAGACRRSARPSSLWRRGINCSIRSASNFGRKNIEPPDSSSVLIATNRPCV